MVVAACGDDDGGDEPDVDPAIAPFCESFGEMLTTLDETGLDTSDPIILEVVLTELARIAGELRDAAPSEVRAAASAFAADVDEVLVVWRRYGFDQVRVQAGAPSEDRAVLDAFGQPPTGPGVDDPLLALESYFSEHCAPGVTLPPDLTATTSP